MRINEIVTSREQYYQHRMNESVVKPYIAYLKGIGQYLAEDEQLGQQAAQAIAKQEKAGQEVVLPPAVQQKFSQELDQVQPGPVQGFEQKAAAELEKIPDPEVKKSLLQRIKDGLKNPDTQQVLLTAVSTIAGMAAGAVSMGLGADVAKKATQSLGTGLIAAVNKRLAGADWADALQHGAQHGATHAASGALDVDHDKAAKALGIGSANDQGKAAEPAQGNAGAAQSAGVAPGVAGDLTNKWQEFINYGQNLVKQMAQVAPPKTA